MNRLLLIVDPQNDFITGSLPVGGAEEAMNALACYVAKTAAELDCVVVTGDRHQSGHCSFKEQGGEWPEHCVVSTEGAEIWPPLKKALEESGLPVAMLYKGCDAMSDQYSIFENPEAAEKLDRIVAERAIEVIDICGLAGDVCVLRTFLDAAARYGRDKIDVLTRFAPSLDGGKALNKALCDR